jgi:DNA-binding NtrC family response regulator
VVVVEDDDGVRLTVGLCLRRYGYRVLEARDGEDALDLIRQHPGRLGLVLTDVAMPRMGGRALAERLAVLRPEVRVLFVSGYPYESLLQTGMLTREMPFLAKPFAGDALDKQVRQLLAR